MNLFYAINIIYNVFLSTKDPYLCLWYYTELFSSMKVNSTDAITSFV